MHYRQPQLHRFHSSRCRAGNGASSRRPAEIHLYPTPIVAMQIERASQQSSTPEPNAVTMDFNAGDVGYVRRETRTYIKNTGDTGPSSSRYSSSVHRMSPVRLRITRTPPAIVASTRVQQARHRSQIPETNRESCTGMIRLRALPKATYLPTSATSTPRTASASRAGAVNMSISTTAETVTGFNTACAVFWLQFSGSPASRRGVLFKVDDPEFDPRSP